MKAKTILLTLRIVLPLASVAFAFLAAIACELDYVGFLTVLYSNMAYSILFIVLGPRLLRTTRRR